MPSITVSGIVRVSWGSSIYTQYPFSSLYTASVVVVHSLQLSTVESNTIVSLANVSNPGFVVLVSDGLVRVNYGNEPSAVSAGSAGRQFHGLFAQVGSGMSGPPALHFANSLTSAVASVAIIMGM